MNIVAPHITQACIIYTKYYIITDGESVSADPRADSCRPFRLLPVRAVSTDDKSKQKSIIGRVLGCFLELCYKNRYINSGSSSPRMTPTAPRSSQATVPHAAGKAFVGKRLKKIRSLGSFLAA